MKKSKNGITLSVFIVYCFLLTVVLFLRNGRDFSLEITKLGQRISENANLVPFKTINNYMNALDNRIVSSSVVINNLIGNFVLFLPMGFFLPEITGKCCFIRSEALILIMILLAEIIQLITGLGSFDVDDIILNFTGSIIGYSAFLICKKSIRKADK